MMIAKLAVEGLDGGTTVFALATSDSLILTVGGKRIVVRLESVEERPPGVTVELKRGAP